jgi:hypothetical protein
MQEAAVQPQVRSAATSYRNPLRYTNFYPLYGGANDQVDPVLRVQPVQFQRVLPRYRLSTSETRDLGIGPMFTEVPSVSFPGTRETGSAGEARGGAGAPAASAGQFQRGSAQLEPWKGTRIDLFA